MTITKEGALASFYTVNKAPIKHLKVYFSPKQAGTGDPSPENVREISGWNGSQIHTEGKNLFNVNRTLGAPNPTDLSGSTRPRVMDTEHYYKGIQSENWYHPPYTNTTVSNGIISVTNLNNNGYGVGFPVQIKGNTKYTLSFTAQNSLVSFGYYDSEWNYLSETSTGAADNPKTITTPANACYVDIVFRAPQFETATYTYSNIQFEKGSIATEYEPYRGHTYNLDWSNDIGTIYGGYVDLVTGELVEQWRMHLLSDLYVTKTNGEGLWKHRFDIRSPWINSTIGYESAGGAFDAICSMFHRDDSSENGEFLTYAGLIDIYDDTSTTVEEFKEKYGECQIACRLQPKAETTYQLTPTQLQTLIGQNNIGSNADRVEVEYDLAESNDELYHRRNLLLRSYPSIKTASNSFTTDLSAPLKSAKIYFNPVQEGTGDPSPTNIRPITGWTGLSLYHSGENLYTPNAENRGYINASGTIIVDDNNTYTDLIPVVAGQTYSFKCTTAYVNGSTNRRVHGYNSSGNWVQQIIVGTTAEKTVEDKTILIQVPSGISYIRVSFKKEDLNVSVRKENVYNVDWSNDIGTVYGGYVDLVNGKLYQEWCNVKVADINWNNYSGKISYYGNITKNLSNMTRASNTYIYSDTALMNPYGGHLDANIGYITYLGEQITYSLDNNYIWIKLPNSMEFNEANSWISETYPTAVLCYKLAIPKYIATLSPIQLKTLKGINNFWTTANGPVDIQYYTH